MADEIKNVIIIGAGGNLGPSILEALDDDSYFTVSVISRTGSNSTFPSHIKVHRLDDSYPDDDLLTAFKGQDAVVLLLPPNDISLHKRIIDVAIKAGVKRVIPGEFGNDTSNDKIVEEVPIFKGKQDIKKYLQSKEDTGLSWTAVVNGGFFDWGLTTSFLGFDIKSRKATIYDDGNTQSPATLLSTVGIAVASVLKHASQTANRNIYISDYVLTQNKLLASLEKATGEKWEVSNRSTAEAKSTGFEKLGKGDFSGIQDQILALVYNASNGANYTETKELDNELLGLPKPGPLDEVVEKIVKGEKV